jgi:hypothetical protein
MPSTTIADVIATQHAPDIEELTQIDLRSGKKQDGAAPALGHALAIASVHFHSITSSARSRIDCGIVSPSALAVLRLITNSNFVGCCTGKSAGLAPL